jgi:predicted nucleic acid-binding protein
VALVLDANVVWSIIDRGQPRHADCVRLIEGASEPLIIPTPVMAEVDYFISRRMHPGVLIALLHDVEMDNFSFADVAPEDLVRISSLVTQYAGSDIGFVDASVLALVERLNEPKLATLDHRHFAMMRPRHVDALTLLP